MFYSLIHARQSGPEVAIQDFTNNIIGFNNLRIVAGFFAGSVLFGSFIQLYQSRYLRFCLREFYNRLLFPRPSSSALAEEGPQIVRTDSKTVVFAVQPASTNKVQRIPQDVLTQTRTTFTIFLLLFFSSIFDVLSILQMNKDAESHDRLCVFILTSQSITLQFAHLLGLVMLRPVRSEAKPWQVLGFWLSLSFDLGLVVGTIAMTGARMPETQSRLSSVYSSSIDDSPAFGPICFKQHFLPAALAASVLSIVVEILLLFRLVRMSLVRSKDEARGSTHVQIIRVVGLLLFDLATFIPNSSYTSFLGDRIPFDFAAMVLIITFGCNSSYNNARSDDIEQREMAGDSHPPSEIKIMTSDKRMSEHEQEDEMYDPRSRFSFTITASSAMPSQARTSLETTSTRLNEDNLNRSGRRPSFTAPAIPLVRPIIPKSILARQFVEAQERSPSRTLKPRPVPAGSLPIIVTDTTVSRTDSYSGSIAKSIRSVYGSDIIRFEPGAKVKNRMKAPSLNKKFLKVSKGSFSSSFISPSARSRSRNTNRTSVSSYDAASYATFMRSEGRPGSISTIPTFGPGRTTTELSYRSDDMKGSMI